MDLFNYITQIVCAYTNKNNLTVDQLTKLITELHELFKNLSDPNIKTPFINVKKSITSDYIICLEDGKKLTVLTRYIKNKYNLTPDQYRAKWNLPSDYPMVAPNYTSTRSSIAKSSSLGKKSNKSV